MNFQEYRKATGTTPAVIAIFEFPCLPDDCIDSGTAFNIPEDIVETFDAPLLGIEDNIGVVWIEEKYLTSVNHKELYERLRNAYEDLMDELEIF